MRAKTAKNQNTSALQGLTEHQLGCVQGGSGKGGPMPGLGAGAGSLVLPKIDQAWLARNPIPNTRVPLPPMTQGAGGPAVSVSASGPSPLNFGVSISQTRGSVTTQAGAFHSNNPMVGQGMSFGIGKRF